MDCACPKPKVALALQVFFDVQGWSDRPVTLSGYTLPSHSLMARLANRKYMQNMARLTSRKPTHNMPLTLDVLILFECALHHCHIVVSRR